MASEFYFNSDRQVLKVRYCGAFEHEDFRTFMRCLRREQIPSLSHVIHDMTEVQEVRVDPAELVDWALERSSYVSDLGGAEVRVAFLNVPERLQTHVEVWRSFFENQYTPLKYGEFADQASAERWAAGTAGARFEPIDC